jgi:hypothetical protein
MIHTGHLILFSRLFQTNKKGLDKPTDHLYTKRKRVIQEMSIIIKQVIKESRDIPKVAIRILAAIFVLSMFIVGYERPVGTSISFTYGYPFESCSSDANT